MNLDAKAFAITFIAGTAATIWYLSSQQPDDLRARIMQDLRDQGYLDEGGAAMAEDEQDAVVKQVSQIERDLQVLQFQFQTLMGRYTRDVEPIFEFVRSGDGGDSCRFMDYFQHNYPVFYQTCQLVLKDVQQYLINIDRYRIRERQDLPINVEKQYYIPLAKVQQSIQNLFNHLQ